MKIRTRLSLLFILCSTLSLVLCGALLLHASVQSTVRSAEDNAVSELSMLKTSFSSMAVKDMDSQSSDTVSWYMCSKAMSTTGSAIPSIS